MSPEHQPPAPSYRRQPGKLRPGPRYPDGTDEESGGRRIQGHHPHRFFLPHHVAAHLRQNRENISQILDSYIQDLTQVKELVDQADEQGIYDLFDTSRNYRNSFPSSSAGPIKKSFAVYCDIIDEAGGIAAIATILASNNLNLKNIGIVHNREFEEGVLRIEFYDEASSRRAAELLQKFRYIVYER